MGRFRPIPRTAAMLMMTVIIVVGGGSMTCSICQASSSPSSSRTTTTIKTKIDHVIRQQPIPLRLSKDDTTVARPRPPGGPMLILQVEQALQQEPQQQQQQEAELKQPLHLESLFSPRRRSRRTLKPRILWTQQQQESIPSVSGMSFIQEEKEEEEEGTLDLLAVCNGFQPTDDDEFLRHSICTCLQGGSVVQALCEQNNICMMQSEHQRDGKTTPQRIYGDYSYQAHRDFKSPTALEGMEPTMC
jgi:hypothetical protein